MHLILPQVDQWFTVVWNSPSFPLSCSSTSPFINWYTLFKVCLTCSSYMGILALMWRYLGQSMVGYILALPRSYSPQIITNVRRVWWARRPLATVSWNLRVSVAANFPPILTFIERKWHFWQAGHDEGWETSGHHLHPQRRPFSKSLVTKIGVYLVMETPGGHHHSAVNTSPHIWTSG